MSAERRIWGGPQLRTGFSASFLPQTPPEGDFSQLFIILRWFFSFRSHKFRCVPPASRGFWGFFLWKIDGFKLSNRAWSKILWIWGRWRRPWKVRLEFAGFGLVFMPGRKGCGRWWLWKCWGRHWMLIPEGFSSLRNPGNVPVGSSGLAGAPSKADFGALKTEFEAKPMLGVENSQKSLYNEQIFRVKFPILLCLRWSPTPLLFPLNPNSPNPQ